MESMKKFLIISSILLFSVVIKAQDQSMAYTQVDRDRMVRVETKVEALETGITRLEDKFDSYFMWGFGLVLMSIFGLIGFIIYDRRTTLAPVENKTEKIIRVLREAAEENATIKEALKKAALW
jgi:hypothetical protein